MSIPISLRLRLLRLGRGIAQGALIAHPTSTLPGIAALPWHNKALWRLRRFKGRQGPFLLLAADRRTALACFRWLPSALRIRAGKVWPGPVTLVAPARPHLRHLGRRGTIAVRVDADPAVRLLARAAGGLIISTSLNRKGRAPQQPSRRLRWRWRRWLDAVIAGRTGAGHPSEIWSWTRRGFRRVR